MVIGCPNQMPPLYAVPEPVLASAPKSCDVGVVMSSWCRCWA
jgi:hypothetical protein